MWILRSLLVQRVNRLASDVIGGAWMYLSRVNFLLLLHRLVVVLVHAQLMLLVFLRKSDLRMAEILSVRTVTLAEGVTHRRMTHALISHGRRTHALISHGRRTHALISHRRVRHALLALTHHGVARLTVAHLARSHLALLHMRTLRRTRRLAMVAEARRVITRWRLVSRELAVYWSRSLG